MEITDKRKRRVVQLLRPSFTSPTSVSVLSASSSYFLDLLTSPVPLFVGPPSLAFPSSISGCWGGGRGEIAQGRELKLCVEGHGFLGWLFKKTMEMMPFTGSWFYTPWWGINLVILNSKISNFKKRSNTILQTQTPLLPKLTKTNTPNAIHPPHHFLPLPSL